MHDIDLSPEVVLRLAPGIRTRLDAAGHVLVDSTVGTIVDIGPRGFAILAMFARPLSLGDAVEQLEAFMTEMTRGATLRRAIETCVQPDDDGIAKLGEIFTDDVTVWSPNMLAIGLADLAENLAFRQMALSDVDIRFDSLGVFGNKGVAEFRVTATFSGPFVIEEEVVIDPNGEQLLLGAAAVADFEAGKIKGLRAYFDDASLLEQMLPA